MKKTKQQSQQFVALPLFDVTTFSDPTSNRETDPAITIPGLQHDLDDEDVADAANALHVSIAPTAAPDTLLVSLNDPQRQAVTATRGPVLILAGPGSGKTRVITHRIAYLLQQEQIHPKHILAVTFTNKAANEMRERLERMVGEHARYLVVSTFHSLCARILRRSKEFLLRFALTPAFSIADADDQERLLREVLREPGMDLSALDENKRSAGALRDLISRAKADMCPPDALERQAEQEHSLSLQIVARVYRAYERLLRKF